MPDSLERFPGVLLVDDCPCKDKRVPLPYTVDQLLSVQSGSKGWLRTCRPTVDAYCVY